MRQIILRERITAAAIHFCVTLFFAAIAAGAIFFVWFPGRFSTMVGGAALFTLVISCDLILGPLLSLVVFNSKKSRKELVLDYAFIGCIQLGALMYGVSVVADSRPLFIAFTRDRFEVVTALELDVADLYEASNDEFKTNIWLGPRVVGVRGAINPDEHQQMLLSGLSGKDVQLLPKYYRPYDELISDVRKRSLPIADLQAKRSDVAASITVTLKDLKLNPTEVGWLPVHHRFGVWTALIDMKTGYPVEYLPVDPY